MKLAGTRVDKACQAGSGVDHASSRAIGDRRLSLSEGVLLGPHDIWGYVRERFQGSGPDPGLPERSGTRVRPETTSGRRIGGRRDGIACRPCIEWPPCAADQPASPASPGPISKHRPGGDDLPGGLDGFGRGSPNLAGRCDRGASDAC